MCFNLFYKNKDDHGKNFSFLYYDGKKGYVLFPAYDLTKTPEELKKSIEKRRVRGGDRRRDNPPQNITRRFVNALRLFIQNGKNCSLLQKITKQAIAAKSRSRFFGRRSMFPFP